MKRILLFCFMIVSAHLLVAQPPQHVQRTPEQEAAKHTEMMKRDLQLTASQVDTIYNLNLKYAQLRREVASREAWHTCLEQKDIELQAILTPEQYEQHILRQRTNTHHVHRAPTVLRLQVDTVASHP